MAVFKAMSSQNLPLPKFLIHFTYTDTGKLRSKTKVVVARSGNDAIMRLRRVFGFVKVWRCEKRH